MSYDGFFWLHIKKSAGITARRLLQPYYVTVDRLKKPKNFIQARPEEYNDILNNYRVVLGEYQFRRTLFAKKYLYPESWDRLYSFAFSREPTDRCVSMFYYLYWRNRGFLSNLIVRSERSIQERKLLVSTSYAFDAFLDRVYEARISDSIYSPIDNHFTTHTAPMWEDVTDLEGQLLLSRVFRLENLVDGINSVFERVGVDKRLENNAVRLNENRARRAFCPTKKQMSKIKSIYSHDFDIYEKLS